MGSQFYHHVLSDLKACSYKNTKAPYLGTVVFNRKFQLIFLYRLGRLLKRKKRLRNLNHLLTWIMGSFYSSEISFGAKIGQRVTFNHPIGIVIGQGVVIEDDVTIFQRVTLGSHGKPDQPWSYPTIKKDAVIYASSSIIGKVIVGRGSIIGAHSLVKTDVPDHCIAAGAPAKVIRKINSESHSQRHPVNI